MPAVAKSENVLAKINAKLERIKNLQEEVKALKVQHKEVVRAERQKGRGRKETDVSFTGGDVRTAREARAERRNGQK